MSQINNLSRVLIVYFLCKATGLGFEPRYTVPETVVLPLDDPVALKTKY